MTDLINKLERMAQTGSLKQNSLSQLLHQQQFTSNELAMLKSSNEQIGILLPDDDED